MSKTALNESHKDNIFYDYVTNQLIFSKKWIPKKHLNNFVSKVLATASKNSTGERGEPDFIYINEDQKLLILMENKDNIALHKNKESKVVDATKYAVDGILHYLKFFLPQNLTDQSHKKYFQNWKILGLAVSGEIFDPYNHLISTFVIKNNQIAKIENIKQILSEEDYLSYFVNIDIEEITRNISTSSKNINNLLRSIDSQKRPTLLSALMICLFESTGQRNDFKNGYLGWSPATIVNNVPTTLKSILEKEGISRDKIQVLLDELVFINNDHDINNTNILRQILEELERNVVPLFNKKTNYDIIGKFYEEFLRYAGIANVKKGIVLTPHHITTLFTNLIDIKINDVFLDPCCGTGSFLIAGMNKLIKTIEKSDIADKIGRIKEIKTKQLIGFEKNPTMYTLSISNMLFRGDGKSQIFNLDYFADKADEEINKLRLNHINPTIGFINPPYGGSDNSSNPTKKEIQFLARMLDQVSRYGIIIAPMSTFFKDPEVRNLILSKHTLKYVIHTPSELFQPNASTHTVIAVFETHLPHSNKEVVFYDLKDDGFVLSKNKGRTDVYNKWDEIEQDLLTKLKNPKEYIDNQTLIQTKIKQNDEWIIQAHSKTNYSDLTEESFEKVVKEYIIFKTKKDLNLLDKNLDEVSMVEILNENLVSGENIFKQK